MITDPHARIRDAAFLSIGRACMFAVLAVITSMSGFITWPVMAFKMGALGFMLCAAILALRSFSAAKRPYRRTETWILLGRRHHLPEDRAQGTFASVLGATYWRFAEYAALLACVMGCLAALFWLAGSPD